MTLLTHTGGPFEPAPYSSAKRELTGAANAHLATIKRVCLFAAISLLAGGAVIAVKTAIFFWRFPLLTYGG